MYDSANFSLNYRQFYDKDVGCRQQRELDIASHSMITYVLSTHGGKSKRVAGQ